MKIRTLLVVVSLLMILSVSAAQAIQVTAGWIESDIGLDDVGNDFYAGVQESWPLGAGLFDFTVAGEYQRKTGSMHRYYSDPHTGLTQGLADVRLDCFQTAAFVGWQIPVSGFKPRLYTGTSVVLKLSETWDEPEGETNGDYGYENMDFQVHLGLTIEASRFLLDVRYSVGLMEQLINKIPDALYSQKAEVVDLPDDGAKINSLQAGVGYSF